MCTFGYYQDTPNSLQCFSCPPSTNTTRVGASNASECLGNVVLLLSNEHHTLIDQLYFMAILDFFNFIIYLSQTNRQAKCIFVVCMLSFCSQFCLVTLLFLHFLIQEYCQPGHYSPTGLAPCAVCPSDTYQASTLATVCSRCANGTKTLAVARQSESDCKGNCKL